MPTCEVVRLPGGGVALVRTSRSGSTRRRRCRWCTRPSTKLCDHPKATGGTCSAPICDAHAQVIGPDRDLCPDHAQPGHEAAH